MINQPQKVTSTEVSIRTFKPEDAEFLARYLANDKILDQLRDHIPRPYSLSDAREHIERSMKDDPVVNFAVEYSGEFAGSISVKPQDDIYSHSAETGYWIAEPFWNKGVATAAIKLAVQYGFEELGLMRVFAGVMENNTGSIRALVKAGFQPEGILRKGIVKNGEYLDEHRFAILNPEIAPK